MGIELGESMMLTPEGLNANKIDKVMLLSMWAKFVAEQQNLKKHTEHEMIYAGIGWPTYRLHPYLRTFLSGFWRTHSGEAITYGPGKGDVDARAIMAQAMATWYGVPIDKEHILFTVGGASGLYTVFAALKAWNAKTPHFRVITPFPYYTLYADNGLHLHPINVMDLPGYHLTADALAKSIKSAEKLAQKDSGYPRAVLLCDPNNPLGSVLGADELQKIAAVLRVYPKLMIILDEAYAELVLDGSKHVSLLTVAPDLRERIIILRSATKSLSAAGERMAITLAFNPALMSSILAHHIRIQGHAPRSLQIAYAETMARFSDTDRQELNDFYGKKLAYVSQRLIEMGASMPDKAYKVAGSFYILGDFSDLIGDVLPESSYQALGRRGFAQSDEDVAYSLLFNDHMMLSPCSYYGLEKHQGYLRITCSDSDENLRRLMDTLEERLLSARQRKYDELKRVVVNYLIQSAGSHPIKQYSDELNKCLKAFSLEFLCNDSPDRSTSALRYKQLSSLFGDLFKRVKLIYNQSTQEGKEQAAVRIQSAYRTYLAKKYLNDLKNKQDNAWLNFVAQLTPNPTPLNEYLRQLTVVERLEISLWKQHLNVKKLRGSAHFLMDLFAILKLDHYALVLLLLGLFGSITPVLGGFSAVAGLGATVSCLGTYYVVTRHGFFSGMVKEQDSLLDFVAYRDDKGSPK
jgi:aspartate aminotransferase/aminotransferase